MTESEMSESEMSESEPTTSVTIADTPEQLTPEWLTAALRAGGTLEGDISVTAAETRPLGTGQMSDSLRVTLTYDGPTDAPPTLVAKQPAADETSRNTGLLLRSYEKEVRFYQELAPHLPMKTPAVHHSDIDPSTGSFVLLLEDKAPAGQGDQLVGCSPELAESAVAELVNLHAPRWGDDGLTELDWLHGNPELNRQFLLSMLPMFWTGFKDRYGADLPDHVIPAGELLFAGFAGYVEPTDTPLTVVHADYRLDNLLFDPAPATSLAGVVDWQTCVTGVGPMDVAYFIGAGLLEDDRRAHEDALVRSYHDGLLAAGVEGYGWDACWRDYRKGTWAGLIVTVGASMLVEQTERGDEMFRTMAIRHTRHALDLDAADLLT